MLDQLSEKLQKTIRDLSGQGKITERHIDESMREIRIALLEADVNFKVVKDFVASIRQKAIGADVMSSLTPGQQLVKIVRDELVALLGSEAREIQFAKQPPTTILMAGLQGSGKTTTTGKLAGWLARNGRRPVMVSVDVYRPAAMDQLAVIGREVKIPVFDEPAEPDPLARAQKALAYTRNSGFDVLLVDTAGRLHIDEEMMREMERLHAALEPQEVLLVADAMTGQDAVNSARDFNARLALTGVILTKMDGDARGGAALSIKTVTGKPIKFIGVGEKYDALEKFYPDRLAGRILGMGDVLSLIEKAEEAVDQENALKMVEKLRKDAFTLEDFRDQLRQMRKLGPLEQILGMLPSVGPFRGLNKVQIDEKELLHIEAIINSMTPRERANHQLINGSRRKRIAHGSGRPVSEVNRLLKQYVEARKMMKQMSSGILGRQLGKLGRVKLPM